MLGRRVTGGQGRGYQPLHGCRVHDVAEPLTQHQRIGRLNAVDGSAEIDVDHPVPDLDRVVAELAAHGDAGIVEEVVEAALLLGDPLDQTFHAVEVRDVEG